MLLHPRQVFRAIYYASRFRIKKALGIKRFKSTPAVLSDGHASATARYRRICETLLANLPREFSFEDAVCCEIGCGNCLASADLLLGLGASHVFLIETYPITVDDRQAAIIAEFANDPVLPNKGEVLEWSDGVPKLNSQKATVIRELFENTKPRTPFNFIFSFDVLEHVEDLDSFFSTCSRLLRPGASMLHKFDLSGHEFFEDPIPPLDFQTYPDWLYWLMFPPYRRAVRHFADEFVDSMKRNGFADIEITPIREANAKELHHVEGKLRKKAEGRTRDILKLLDLVISAKHL